MKSFSESNFVNFREAFPWISRRTFITNHKKTFKLSLFFHFSFALNYLTKIKTPSDLLHVKYVLTTESKDKIIQNMIFDTESGACPFSSSY